MVVAGLVVEVLAGREFCVAVWRALLLLAELDEVEVREVELCCAF